MKKISIIIPVYNVEKYLNKCLDSIVKQSYKNLEILIIDDGSKDNSLKIAREYEKRDNRIRVFTQKNSGVSSARNLGIKNSTGDYITFVDSDDWLELDMYEKIIDRFNESIDAVVYSFIREYPNRSEREVIPFEKETILNEEEIYSKWIFNLISGEDERESYIMATIWRCIYRRNIIEEYSILFDNDLSYAEDLIFNLKYFTKCKKIYIYNEALYHYRFNTNSLVTKYDSELWNKNLKVNEAIKNIFESNNKEKIIITNEVLNSNGMLINNNNYEINKKIQERINSRLISVCVGCLVNIFHENNNDSISVKYKKVKQILNDKSLVEVKSNYNIKNKKYKLLTLNMPIIPIVIININKMKNRILK